MIDQPETTPEESDRYTFVSLDERLRAEEPPITADDTPPSHTARQELRLRAEEPPIRVDDTSPSRRVPHFFGDEWPPKPVQPSRARLNIAAVLIVIGALGILGVVGFIWANSRDDSPKPIDNTAPIAEALPSVVPAPTLAAATATALPPTASGTDPLTAPQSEAPQAVAQGFPTAAAEEIAAALLTPAPGNPPIGVVQRSSAPFTLLRGTGRTRVEQYTVSDGDTLESIAAHFNLEDYYTLIWSNKSSKYSPLRSGVQLNILPVDGVYYEVTEPITIAALGEKYGVDPYVIIDSEYNDLFGSIPDTVLPEGMWIVVPGGEAERALFLQGPISSGTGSTGTTDTVSGLYTLWGCTANVGGGSPPYSRPLGNFTWMRGFTPGGHTGVDLAASTGDPIYAAGDGTVVYSGWSDGGYGNVVVIAHGSTFSLYGHMSRTGVRCGQQVSAGQVIGAVGNTGNSTGPHLHFEVRDANFNAMNPQNWIGF